MSEFTLTPPKDGYGYSKKLWEEKAQKVKPSLYARYPRYLETPNDNSAKELNRLFKSWITLEQKEREIRHLEFVAKHHRLTLTETLLAIWFFTSAYFRGVYASCAGYRRRRH